MNRHAQSIADLLPHGRGQPGISTRGDHSLRAAAPLLHEAELVKHSTNDAIAQLGNPARQVVERESEGQEARVFHFQPVVEDREAERRAAL